MASAQNRALVTHRCQGAALSLVETRGLKEEKGSLYQDLRLAFGQSVVLVEDLLRDDLARWAALSRAGDPRAGSCSGRIGACHNGLMGQGERLGFKYLSV
jgi:hypothetical protein